MSELSRVNVDVTNPGQFFACCGLLEMADRLWPKADAVASFSTPRFQRSQFQISGRFAFSPAHVIKILVSCEQKAVEPYQPIRGSDGKPVKDVKKTMPVQLQLRDDSDGEQVSLRLAWWLDELAGKQNSFKTWSAHNSADGLIASLARQINADEITDWNLFQHRVGMTSRLGLDPRSSWNTLDTGFSPNDQKLPVDTYPATELLAAIGLETFRPTPADDGYVYAIWPNPLPVVVARAAASGSLDIRGMTRFCFDVALRGKFKYFTKATLLERRTHGRNQGRNVR
jgi:CRISPR-associated protein Csx14